ncbi:hypothetical protein NW801_13620 [Brevibacillus laterosporus]|uniref:Phage ABA sandwich domain-containing protein n=2 Tax=Brevibacillus TaxID=55080 RepID=A0A0F7BYD6_BRELA|nr:MULTISPECIES: hypothetical protein [Brevibacillus]AKF92658.1 hypothetical protein EX87_02420 [Brevibacillus laterosporus]MCR8986062.1 hypothetical protein [Brevibacillus laterosporus]MCZ0831795.1 hypothetical protein [Brevibacillus halotolerans]
MTEQQIIETLATEVMGWVIQDDYRDHLNPRKIYFDEINSKWIGYVEDWNPLEDLNHAFEVVEKLRGSISILVESFPDGYEGLARKEFGDCRVLAEISAKTPQEAICKAAMEAVTQSSWSRNNA